MWIYILLFIAVLSLYSNATTLVKQHKYFKYSMVFLAFFVGLSDMLGGYDRYIYASVFDDAADALRGNTSIMHTSLILMYGKEFGYCAWNFLVALVSSNRYIFIMLTTFLIYFLFYRAIKKQTENPMFALILFMALNFFFSFTYLRQMMAAALVWQALQYIEKRNFKMFCLWVFIAFSFHNSAIIFFPVYFIPFKKFGLKWVTVAIVVSLVLGLSGLPSAVFDAYNSIDAERLSAAGYAEETGFRYAYLIEALFFYYFIRKYYKALGNDSNSLVGLNLSIIFCCILLFFTKSENGGRLGWYFMIGLYSISSTICSNKKRITRPAYIIIVSCFLYFRIVFSWGVLLSPYKTIFTNGIRAGDFIEQKYEYDHKYDNNKFYR